MYLIRLSTIKKISVTFGIHENFSTSKFLQNDVVSVAPINLAMMVNDENGTFDITLSTG